MSGKYGVKETKEAFDLGFALVQAGQCATEDGKVNLGDIACAVPVFPKVGAAVEGIGLIPSELGELDAADEKELLDHAAVKLGQTLPDGKLRRCVYAYVKVALALSHAISVTVEAA